MAETTPATRQPPSLFRQIAVRLTVLMAIFALLDIAIVVPMYAFDQQALDEDFIEQQAHRIDRTLAGSIPRLGTSAPLAGLADPIGVSTWNFVVVDERLRPVARREDVRSAWTPDRAHLDGLADQLHR